MMLRGPQTVHELAARAERMARFQSIDDVRTELDLLIGRRPPLVELIERGPGQREDRYAHLLSGDVEMPAPVRFTQPAAASSDVEDRLAALEEQVAALQAQVKALIEER